METIECINTRRSIRKYKDKPVEWDKIVTVLNAGRMAPSAGNLQNWKFIVVREDDVRKKIAQACLEQSWMETAPVHIVVVAEPEKAKRYYGSRGEFLYSIQNCAAAIENMLLAAHDIGLGTCWIGAFNEDLIRRAVNLPEHVTPQAVITLGYADEKPIRPPKTRLEYVVWLEKWWGRGVSDISRGYKSVRLQNAFKKVKKNLKRLGKRLVE